jgi:acetoin utilization protein AcuC
VCCTVAVMSQAVRVVWDDELISYDFGPGHPLAPVRVELTMALARDLRVLDGVEVVGCVPATDDELALVHERDYIEGVKGVSRTGRPDLRWGLGTPDNPAFAGVHEASALVAGASLEAAKAVWAGQADHALNIAGGLHHAMPFTASGFCVYNDPAIAIAWLLSQGASRIAYVDVDVHHGDGVQAAFYDDPRVLTISLHQDPRTLFPGTGFPSEIGRGAAEGTALNVALPPGTDDAGWLRAFRAVVPGALRAFGPDVLVTQCGCDTHRDDPLANLELTVDGQRIAIGELHTLAHEVAGGRWLAFGGGGYGLVRCVPRTWTHLIAEMSGRPLDPETIVPPGWAAHVRNLGGRPPERMGERTDEPEVTPWEPGRDSWLDRTIGATRQAAFPLLGLDPYDPRD